MTTISQHGEQMGEAAAKVLIEQGADVDTETITKIITTDLVIRDSTR